MKKLSALVLAFALAVPMGLTAFADDTPPADTKLDDATTTASIAVQGTYQPGAAAGDSVIYVDVAWDAMDFTYTAPSKGDWNPEKHTYQNPVETGGWAPTNGTAPKITVINHSNTSVSTTLAFASTAPGVVGSFTDTTSDANPIPGNVLILDTAVGTEPKAAPTAQAVFTVSGDAIDKDQSIGTITVTVAKATEVGTEAELQAAIDARKPYIKLTEDITREYDTVPFDYDAVFDLDGHTLTVNGGQAIAVGFDNSDPTLMIKGCDSDGNYGKIQSNYGPALDISSAKAVAVENCNIISTAEEEPAISPSSDVNLLLKNCTTKSENSGWGDIEIPSESGTITLCGEIEISKELSITEDDKHLICLAGIYRGLDPNFFVDTNIYTVTKEQWGSGYIVTRKQPDQTGNQ